jgi:hypothetical protein
MRKQTAQAKRKKSPCRSCGGSGLCCTADDWGRLLGRNITPCPACGGKKVSKTVPV